LIFLHSASGQVVFGVVFIVTQEVGVVDCEYGDVGEGEGDGGGLAGLELLCLGGPVDGFRSMVLWAFGLAQHVLDFDESAIDFLLKGAEAEVSALDEGQSFWVLE
jgi:hypothetical protein